VKADAPHLPFTFIVLTSSFVYRMKNNNGDNASAKISVGELFPYSCPTKI